MGAPHILDTEHFSRIANRLRGESLRHQVVTVNAPTFSASIFMTPAIVNDAYGLAMWTSPFASNFLPALQRVGWGVWNAEISNPFDHLDELITEPTLSTRQNIRGFAFASNSKAALEVVTATLSTWMSRHSAAQIDLADYQFQTDHRSKHRRKRSIYALRRGPNLNPVLAQCVNCDRNLTTFESALAGYGPECLRKMSTVDKERHRILPSELERIAGDPYWHTYRDSSEVSDWISSGAIPNLHRASKSVL